MADAATAADAIAPLAVDVVKTLGESSWQPVFGFFRLAYVLLVGLVISQVTLTIRARPR